MAVAASGRFRTWSVSSSDVEAGFGRSKSRWFDIIGARDVEERRALNVFPSADWRSGVGELDSFELFVQFLRTPAEQLDQWGELALSTAFLPIALRSIHAEAWSAGVVECAPPNVSDELIAGLSQQHLFGADQRAPAGFVARLFVAISAAGFQAQDPGQMRVLFELDDADVQREREEFHSLWNGTLRLFNLFQFLGTSLFVTSTTQEEFAFGELLKQMVAPVAESQDDIAWLEAEALTRYMDDRYVDYLREYRAAGAPPPIGGYEPLDHTGLPVGPPAEVAWPDARVALFAGADVDPFVEETLAAVRNAGWRAYTIDHFVGRVVELMNLLNTDGR